MHSPGVDRGGARSGPGGRLEGLAFPSWNVYVFAGESVVESMQSRKTFSRVYDLSFFALKMTENVFFQIVVTS